MEAVAITFSATGLNLTKDTLLVWPLYVIKSWFKFCLKPPAGISHNLHVASSEAVANIFSLKGENAISNTERLCPFKIGVLIFTFVGKGVSNTATLPGVLFQEAAINEPLHAIKFPSVTSETKFMLVNLYDFSSPIIFLYLEVLFPPFIKIKIIIFNN